MGTLPLPSLIQEVDVVRPRPHCHVRHDEPYHVEVQCIEGLRPVELDQPKCPTTSLPVPLIGEEDLWLKW